ncbi:nucleotidyltransferase family protein [Aurantimonas sp. A2-1-M11]|uniref:nucleotidyltransferase family protein n=1 Tax=Aurantimonas sp. A2-1-M11 TaxID=3113712 RepID=UPI003FA5BEFD
MLADQPLLGPEHLDGMIAAFANAGDGAIVAASDGGQRRNPVLIATSYADEIAAITGDVGAQSLIAAHPGALVSVEIGSAASVDVDTPEAMRAAGGAIVTG